MASPPRAAVPARLPLALRLDANCAQEFANVVGNVIADLVAVLFKGGAGHFLDASDIAVDGTERAVVRLRLRSGCLDKQLRAALRAAGFDLDRSHGSSGSGVAPESMEGEADAVTASASEFPSPVPASVSPSSRSDNRELAGETVSCQRNTFP